MRHTFGHEDTTQQTQQNHKSRSINRWGCLAAVIFSIVAFVILTCHNHREKNIKKEQTAFLKAIKANEIKSMKRYLQLYAGQNETHTQQITHTLNHLRTIENEWNNVLKHESITAIKAFIRRFPDSRYTRLALLKADSMDWQTAADSNTVDAYGTYCATHPHGEYAHEAQMRIRNLKAYKVDESEKKMIIQAVDDFFDGISQKNITALISCFNYPMIGFLGVSNAGPQELETFLEKIYKPNVKKITWKISRIKSINKREIGLYLYEYKTKLRIDQWIECIDAEDNEHNKYNVKTTIDPEGKITEWNMFKIEEDSHM